MWDKIQFFCELFYSGSEYYFTIMDQVWVKSEQALFNHKPHSDQHTEKYVLNLGLTLRGFA